MTVIRKPAVSGSFYPAERDVLARQMALFLSEAGNAPDVGDPVPKAIIGPHAGYVYSGPVAARAYARLAKARGRISRVVLIGPSHHVAFRGLAVDASDAWETPYGTVALDTEAIARLRRLPMVGQLDAAHQREHALEVHVPFLQHVLGDFRLVPIVAGDAPPDAVAALFDAVWGGPETLIVVSTDLSHYLDYASCQRLDAQHGGGDRTFRWRRHRQHRGMWPGADARPAARGATARDVDRAAGPAQLRRHGGAARSRRRLWRVGVV